MITLDEYNEIQENIEIDLYELIEMVDNDLQITMTQDQGYVNIHLDLFESDTFAAHSILINDFKQKSLKELNNYINQVWYYNQIEKGEC